MGKIELNKQIIGSMGTWGGNYSSTVGCSHDTMADHIDQEIENEDITLNKMSKMDASHAKTASKNPGFDKGFWAKANPLMDTTGNGKLTRSLKD